MSALSSKVMLFLKIVCFLLLVHSQKGLSNLRLGENLVVEDEVADKQHQRGVFASTENGGSDDSVNEPNLSDEQEGQSNDNITKFQRDLLKKCWELANKIDAAKKDMVKKHKSERAEMALPDERAINRADQILAKIREAALLLNEPRVQSVVVREEWRYLLGSDAIPPDKVRTTVKTEFRDIAVMNRGNVRWILAQAEREHQRIVDSKLVPPEILQRQQDELKEYKIAEEQLDSKIATFRRDAMRSLRAMGNQPVLLNGEASKWNQKIDLLDEQADRTLQNISKAFPRDRRIEPLDYYIASDAGQSRSRGADSKVQVIVRANVRTAYFKPSVQEYQRLRIDKASFNLVSFNLNLFKLITKRGQEFRAHEFIEPHTWDGDVIAGPSANAQEAIRRADRRCIISGAGSEMVIKIGWLLDPKDCEGPFVLQFDRFESVPVPQKVSDESLLPAKGAKLRAR